MVLIKKVTGAFIEIKFYCKSRFSCDDGIEYAFPLYFGMITLKSLDQLIPNKLCYNLNLTKLTRLYDLIFLNL